MDVITRVCWDKLIHISERGPVYLVALYLRMRSAILGYKVSFVIVRMYCRCIHTDKVKIFAKRRLGIMKGRCHGF